MRRLAAAIALAACLWSNVSVAAPASCDAPSLPPTEASVAAGPGDTRIHVLIGMVGTCQVALREFRVALPALRGISSATAQLALAGFTRRYGLHQIGFTLRKVEAAPDPQGVTFGSRQRSRAWTAFSSPTRCMWRQTLDAVRGPARFDPSMDRVANLLRTRLFRMPEPRGRNPRRVFS